MAEFNCQTYPVIIAYELELKVKSHGLFTDFEVKVPIVIGTKPTSDEEQQQQGDNSGDEFAVNASIPDYNELPPSYESVVLNETL